MDGLRLDLAAAFEVLVAPDLVEVERVEVRDLRDSRLQRTGAALELECLKQSRFSVRAKLNTLGLKKFLGPDTIRGKRAT